MMLQPSRYDPTGLHGDALAEAMRETARKMTPEQAQKFLQRIGILDASGNLTEPYKP